MFRLIYRSQSRIPADEVKPELGGIFATARRNNKRLGVTGALIITDDAFAQALEGDEAVVRELYETICRDPRHEGVTLMEADAVEERVFGRWAMAKVAEGGGPDIRLASNAGKRTIVAVGADEHLTPDQGSVLATMREALVHEAPA